MSIMTRLINKTRLPIIFTCFYFFRFPFLMTSGRRFAQYSMHCTSLLKDWDVLCWQYLLGTLGMQSSLMSDVVGWKNSQILESLRTGLFLNKRTAESPRVCTFSYYIFSPAVLFVYKVLLNFLFKSLSQFVQCMPLW